MRGELLKLGTDPPPRQSGGGGWYVYDLIYDQYIPIHPDDIEKFTYYDGGVLRHSYENMEVDYTVVNYKHNFFSERKVAKLDIRGMKIKQILNEI